MTVLRSIIATGLLAASPLLAAAEESRWYVKPTLALSNLSDTSGRRIDGSSQSASLALDSGFASGLTLGYQLGTNLGAEVAWEYRTNDAETRLANGTRFSGGNYASSIFYLNGIWHFDAMGPWRPYVGAGLGFVQEIDVDFEGNGPEQSFSESGDTAYQIFGGVAYRLSERLRLGAELRYSDAGAIDLPAEENATGSLSGLDYNPVSLGVSLSWDF